MARKIKETHVFEDQWLEHWEVDSAADLQNLPECNPGSTVLVKDTGETVTVGDSGIPGAESGGGGGGGTKFDVVAITFTTDGPHYWCYGVVCDASGSVVAVETEIEDGKTYYFPLYSPISIESLLPDDLGRGVMCTIDFAGDGWPIANNILNGEQTFAVIQVGESGTLALTSALGAGWG